MQFKITIFTGIFFLLICSLSIANPISQTETPPQKTEQTHKKKPNFFQKIILKKIQNKIEDDTERASPLAIASLLLGVASFPLIIALGMLGGLTALAAIVTGSIALTKKKVSRKSRGFSIAGIVLGGLFVLVALFALVVFISTGQFITG